MDTTAQGMLHASHLNWKKTSQTNKTKTAVMRSAMNTRRS